MNLRLGPVDPDTYAREVLPLTAELWAGRRDFERYVTHTLEIARSGYGRRHYRTVGLFDGATLVASFKRYERTIRSGPNRLRAIGIGAVYTPNALRGRGYASAMLAMVLDESRDAGYDLAYLFSDIRPAFYEELGFSTLPSRSMSLRADSLAGTRIEVRRIEDGDWAAVRRIFELSNAQAPWAFTRTPLVWDWIRLRMQHGSEHPLGETANLIVRSGRSTIAYVLGVRAPQHDAYIVDEFGYADANASLLVPSLLRSAAGDMRRITGWVPPAFARGLLPKASVRKRTDAIFMAAPLSRAAHAWLTLAKTPSHGDGAWSSDHI